MDDTAEKLRRNFVGVSTAVLSLWWLQAAMPSQLTFMGVPFGSINPERLWGLGVALLLYTGGRYHFSEKRSENADAYAKDHRRRLNNKARWHIRKKLAAKVTEKLRARGRDRVVSPVEFAVVIAEPAANWRGFTYASAIWDEMPDDFPDDGFEVDAEYNDYMPVNPVILSWMYSSTFLGSATFSNGAFEVLTPYLLGGAAAVLCALKIFF